MGIEEKHPEEVAETNRMEDLHPRDLRPLYLAPPATIMLEASLLAVFIGSSRSQIKFSLEEAKSTLGLGQPYK